MLVGDMIGDNGFNRDAFGPLASSMEHSTNFKTRIEDAADG